MITNKHLRNEHSTVCEIEVSSSDRLSSDFLS